MLMAHFLLTHITNFYHLIEHVKNQLTTHADNLNYFQDGPFDWQPSQQGIILSCYFWGYLISQVCNE